MKRTLVCGDIHGAHKALIQCLERSNFDSTEDTLIQLGDVVDGYSKSYEVVEELLNIPNLISIKGNHDDWFLQWIDTEQHGSAWTQGGFKTLQSYGFNCLGEDFVDFQVKWSGVGAITNLQPKNLPDDHKEFFRSQLPYYILNDEEDNRTCFVHGGFNRHVEFEDQYPPYIYWWDRDLWYAALCYKGIPHPMDNSGKKFRIKTPFKDVFIGHTATTNWKTDKPMNAANIWNVDTGCGWPTGKLTFMDIKTREYWQSDKLGELYPGQQGR